MDRFITPGRSPRRDATTDRAGDFAMHSSGAAVAALPSRADTPLSFGADETSFGLEGYGSGRGSGWTGVTQAEVLEMERAALEGMNDGSSLSALEGLCGKQTEPEGRSGADRAGVPDEDELMLSQYEEDSGAMMQLVSYVGGVECLLYFDVRVLVEQCVIFLRQHPGRADQMFLGAEHR